MCCTYCTAVLLSVNFCDAPTPLARQLGGALCAGPTRAGRLETGIMGRGRRWAGCADLDSALRGSISFAVDSLVAVASGFAQSVGVVCSWSSLRPWMIMLLYEDSYSATVCIFLYCGLLLQGTDRQVRQTDGSSTVRRG